MSGSPGGFGAVYNIEGDPSQVIKVIRPGAEGAESVTRQLQGNLLANQAGIETPTVYSSSAGADGEPPHMIMDNVNGGKRSNVATPSSVQMTPQQNTAFQLLYKKLADNGLIWADGKPNNVYFYGSPNAPSVGILDPDMISRASDPEKLMEPTVAANFVKSASPGMQQTVGNELLQEDPRLDAWAIMRDRYQTQASNWSARRAQ